MLDTAPNVSQETADLLQDLAENGPMTLRQLRGLSRRYRGAGVAEKLATDLVSAGLCVLETDETGAKILSKLPDTAPIPAPIPAPVSGPKTAPSPIPVVVEAASSPAPIPAVAVTLLEALASVGQRCFNAGDTVLVSPADAQRLIERRLAVKASPEDAVSAAPLNQPPPATPTARKPDMSVEEWAKQFGGDCGWLHGWSPSLPHNSIA